MPQVVVNDLDPLIRPTQLTGTLIQSILSAGAFLMFLDLGQRGLTHIDTGRAAQMHFPHFVVMRDHAPPPLTVSADVAPSGLRWR